MQGFFLEIFCVEKFWLIQYLVGLIWIINSFLEQSKVHGGKRVSRRGLWFWIVNIMGKVWTFEVLI